MLKEILEEVLLEATMQGNERRVKYLIEEQGINIETSDNKGMTVLMLAARFGHTKLVNYLIEKGANKTKTDNLFQKNAQDHAKTHSFNETAKALE